MKKTHKIISVLLAVAMLLSMAPLSLTASAATPTPYDGVPVTPQKISSGNYARLGLTSSNWSQFKGYYAIRNAKELYGFADIVNNTLAEKTINLNAVLLQDIVINANGGNTYDWRPLYGTGNHRDYRGIIDGNGHYISGIYCTQVAYMVGSNDSVSGLIGGFEGTVKNLIIKDSTFAPNQHLGMYGAIGAITGYPQTCTIINCRVENTKIRSIDNYGQLGGIAGYGNGQGSTIKNCASINVTFSGGGYNAPISNFAPFSDCYTSASDSHTCSNISVEHKEVKATCEYPGLSNYKYCLVCGNITSGTKTETPATGHTWTPATCQAPKTCSSCGLTEGSAVTHKYTTYTLSSNAMCGTNAQETASCDYGCGTTDTKEISGTALVHSLTYSASGNTITAVCANGENCPNPQSTLKILAPADLYADGITAKEATVENNLVDTSVAVGEITYSTADGSAPKTAGTYTASVTVGGATASVEYTLVKRNAAADMFVFTAAANLVYDGTAKYAAVDVSPEITGMGAVTVKYYKDGVETDPINAGTYTVKVSTAESDKYYAINDVEIGSFTIKKIAITVTATDMSKTYGEADPTLAYTLSNEAFASEIVGELARTSGENVGVYEIGQGTLTNDNNPNFEITFAAALFTIEVDASGIDGITPLNVKSSDKAKIEYVYNQLDNAVTDLADDAKKAEWNNLKADCAEMLAVISGTAEEIKRITDAVAVYDIDTVTGDDVPALVQLAQDTDALLSTDNLTAEEIEALVQTGKDIQALISRCDRISAQIGDIIDRMLAYDEATVKSSDKVDIEKLVADIKDLTDGQNFTAAEREYLVNADAKCDKLLAKIAKTKSEYDRVIEAANGYDEATVTSADKDALVQLNEDIYALALTENVTAEEKENLQAAHDKVFALIDKLVGISDEIKRITEKVDAYVFESVKSSDKADIQQLIADIKALLDTQNLTADERALLETADETCDKLIAKIDETIAEVERIDNETNAYDIETVTAEDKENIENLLADIGVITDTDNLTADERTQLNGNAETLESLLETINDVAEEIVRIEDAVNSYDESTIKSSDTDDLNQLKADIKALTDGANLTDGERANLAELDATIAALLKKIADTQVEIERIDEAVNGYDIESVNSADIQALGKLIDDIETLTNGDNITEEEKAALEDNKATIDALVKKLTEVAEEIARVNEAVNGYDEATVKSTDKADLEQLKEDIQALIDSTNTTENEKTALGGMLEKDNALIDVIDEIEQQIEDIGAFENNFNPEKVTSDDKAAIEEKIAEIEAVNPDNLTEEQKAEYAEIKAGFEALLEEIEKAGSEVDAIGAELEMFNEEKVTIFWEDEIEALKSKIDELLADENMGESEKAKLNEYKAQCEKLIEIINNPCDYFSMRLFHFVWDALHWLSSHVVFIFNWMVAMF
ncbi:MAG: MBG domain-containing protein [Acutalibacteraceae bacterium]|nr:MBG domain-containing protein [Acutalibacteraceae bacterium]